MTNEITTAKEYNLPPQIKLHFPNASSEELEMIKKCYSGNNPSPSFQEWLESYQQNNFLKKTIELKRRNEQLEEAVTNQNNRIKNMSSDRNTDPQELKDAQKELKRLQSMLGHSDMKWLDFNKELNKLVQNTLHREQPRKLEVTNVKVTPADVAQMLSDARKEQAIDVEGVEVTEGEEVK